LLPTFNSAFDDFFRDDDGFFTAVSRGTSMPAVNTSETKDKYELEVAAPGMNKDDFKIEIDNNVISISSEKEERKEDQEKNYTRKEYSYSSFYRSFRLPQKVKEDKIQASYNDGVLTISIPKVEVKEPEIRSIPVG
jgi:HSP20 family protein